MIRPWSVGIFLAFLCTGCPDPGGEDGFPDPSGPWAPAVETGISEGAFLSVWGPSADDVWAIGGQLANIADAGRGLAYRRIDGDWAASELPADTPLLNWVHGNADEVWAVGNAGAALRFDGAAWQPVDTGVDVPLWGTFVFGPNDVWAVGGNAFDQETNGIIIHYDGNSWTESPLPELDRSTAAIFKIFGMSPDDIHAVGAKGVLLHYDGSSWTQEASGTGNDMISLWGTAPDDIVAVGGRSVGTVSRWDGSSWTTEELRMLPGLNGVWMDPQGRVSIVGINGAAAVIRDGFEAESEDSTLAFETLHAVFGLDDGTRISVGGTLNSNPPYAGIILENAP